MIRKLLITTLACVTTLSTFVTLLPASVASDTDQPAHVASENSAPANLGADEPGGEAASTDDNAVAPSTPDADAQPEQPAASEDTQSGESENPADAADASESALEEAHAAIEETTDSSYDNGDEPVFHMRSADDRDAEIRATSTSLTGFNEQILKQYLRSGKKGIVYANIDNFAYYEFAESDENGNRPDWAGWKGYGAGLDIDYVIPREARAGDYFTLSWDPETIFIKHEPMYRENENVPYRTLMTEPSQYKDGSSNIFFTVRTPEGAELPGVPILNVYHTKLNELTFVVQPYAEGRKDLVGSAVIGNKVDARRLLAYTDGNGRHLRPNGMYARQQKPDGWHWGNVIGNEVYDFKDSTKVPKAIETPDGKHYFLFMGFEPSYEGMSANATTNPPRQKGPGLYDRYIYERDLHYYSKYMDNAAERIVDGGTNIYGSENFSGVQINYSTWLLRYDHFTGAYAAAATGHGREVLVDVYEDKDYLYAYFIYNANRGSQFKVCDPNRRNWCWSPGDFQGSHQVDFNVPDGEPGSLRIEELRLYRAYDDGGPRGNFSNSHPTTVMPPMSRYPDTRADIGPWIVDGEGRNWRITFPDREKNTYVGKVKMRKIAPVNGKYSMDFVAHTRNIFRPRRDNRMEYQPTSGIGVSLGALEELEDNYFTLRKTDGNRVRLDASYDANAPVRDDMGNTYTLTNPERRIYRGPQGVNYLHKKENGRYVYANDEGELFFEHMNPSGGGKYFIDQYGRRFNEKPDQPHVYSSREKATKHTLALTSALVSGREAEGVYNFYYRIDGAEVTDLTWAGDADNLGGVSSFQSAAGVRYRLRLENTAKNKDRRSAWKPVWIEVNGVRRTLTQTDDYHYSFASAFESSQEEELFKPSRPVLNVEEMKIYIEQHLAERGVSWRYFDSRGNSMNVLGEQDLYVQGETRRRGRLMTVRDNIGNIVHVEHDFNGHAVRVYDETYKIIQAGTINEAGKQGFIVRPDAEDMHVYDIRTAHPVQTHFAFQLTNKRTGVSETVTINEYGRFKYPDLNKEDTYILREIAAAPGYKVHAHPFEIRPVPGGVQFFTHEGVQVLPNSAPLSVVNALENFVSLINEQNFKVKLFKRDGDVPSRGLDGRFELWRAEGNRLAANARIDAGNTSQAGNSLYFKNTPLKPGRYAFVEITAPRGYQMLSEPIFFTIEQDGTVTNISAEKFASAVLNEDGETIEFTIKNYRPYELPATGGSGSGVFIVFGAIIMLVSVEVLRRRRSLA